MNPRPSLGDLDPIGSYMSALSTCFFIRKLRFLFHLINKTFLELCYSINMKNFWRPTTFASPLFSLNVRTVVSKTDFNSINSSFFEKLSWTFRVQKGDFSKFVDSRNYSYMVRCYVICSEVIQDFPYTDAMTFCAVCATPLILVFWKVQSVCSINYVRWTYQLGNDQNLLAWQPIHYLLNCIKNVKCMLFSMQKNALHFP